MNHVSMENSITSLRLCATLDWNRYVDRVSLVEQVLQRDPPGVYVRMDFQSRDRYRHAVEELAEPTGEAQVRVALRAIESARQAAETQGLESGAAPCRLPPDRGWPPRPRDRRGSPPAPQAAPAARALRPRHALLPRLGRPAHVARGGRRGGRRAGGPGAALGVGRGGSGRAHPRQRLRRGPRAPHRPPPRQTAAAAAARPERRRARDGAHDGDRADPPLVRRGRAGSGRAPRGACARQHRPAHPLRAAHRLPGRGRRAPRRRSRGPRGGGARGSRPSTSATSRSARTASTCSTGRGAGTRARGVWMGWERKRGKIEEFNRLLRGATDTSFTVQVGAPAILPQVRYCITLDSDTRLPRDVARQLIGVIEHPLNRPRLDPGLGRVAEGYGILQPRVSVTLASAAGSLFARVYAGHTGVDPYTTAVSDTYQDLFGEGSFTGKGLYDVDAFATALAGRVPENAMLSHDLFEGLHARCALVSDVELVDDFPSSVLAHARRQHRWVRGDWQILLWLLPLVPTPRGPRAQPAAAHQPLEDPRQPASQPGGAGDGDAARLGVDVAARLAARLDPRRAGRARLPADPTGRAPRAGPAAAAAVRGVPARRLGGAGDRARAGAARDHAPPLSRLRHAARHRADAGAHGDHAAATAGVGDRGGRRGAGRRAALAPRRCASSWSRCGRAPRPP